VRRLALLAALALVATDASAQMATVPIRTGFTPDPALFEGRTTGDGSLRAADEEPS
jgi:hypothetical protein